MNIIRPLASTLVAAVVCTSSAFAQERDVILRGGYLWTDAGRFVPNNGIHIRLGKLHQVGGEALPSTASAQLVALDDDDYVLPGFIDLHAHYNLNLFGRTRKDELVVNPVLFLANGVTTTFPAGEFDPEGMLQTRRQIDRGERVGPRIFNSGPYFGSARPGWSHDMPRDVLMAEVDAWVEKGAMGFKAKGIRAEQLLALIERAHLHGLTVTGHLDSGFRDSVNPRDAILMGIDRIEHFLGGDAFTSDRAAYESLVQFKPGTAEFEKIVRLFERHSVFYDVTLSAYGYFGTREESVYQHWTDESRFLTPFVREALKKRPERRINEQFEKIFQAKKALVAALVALAGDSWITIGTDHPSSGDYLAGFCFHRELQALVDAGLTPATVLKMATINGARALRVGDKLGSIATGKLADLVIVRGNPLEDIRNTRRVRWVVKSGMLYDPGTLLKSVEGKLGPADEAEARAW